jgi:hypothetical protein
MRHHSTVLILLLLMGGYAVGQTPRRAIERGKIEELKGLTKVFVISPRDQFLARKVTETIQKKLPGLTFVDSRADTEIWLSVFGRTASVSTRIPSNPGYPPNSEVAEQMSSLSYEQVLTVRGSVTIRRSGKVRRIMEFSKTGGGKNRMAEDFAKEFVRLYEKAMATS